MSCICETCKGHRDLFTNYDGLLSLGSEIFEEACLMDNKKEYKKLRHKTLFGHTEYWKESNSITGHQAWKSLSDIVIELGILFHQIKDKKDNVEHYSHYEKRHYNFVNQVAYELAMRLSLIKGVKLNVKKSYQRA
tara:strand:+ start:89 stop:493 length:405 start_codon:yes stop_codon:yes gene_type:complete